MHRFALLVFAEELWVITGWHRHFRQTRFDILGDGAEIATSHFRVDISVDIDPPRSVLATNPIGRRDHLHIGHFAQGNASAERRIDGEVANALDVAADRFRCPQPHAIHAPVLPDVGDFEAGHEYRRRAADVAGLQTILRRSIEVGADLHLRHIDLLLDMPVDEAGNVFQTFVDGLRFSTQPPELGAGNAHDDRFAGTGQHLLDPLAQVRLHVAIEARVAGDRAFDL